MTFQAYIDTIKTKTGKTPDDFRKLAKQKGLLAPGVKASEIVEWLKTDFGLGHGHAMAIYSIFKIADKPIQTTDELIAKHFQGKKSFWRPVFDNLMDMLKECDGELKISPTDGYLSILKNERKFAIIQITSGRMDIGIKLKDAEPTNRFEAAGSWNVMVTHRVRINDPKEIDKELMDWLHKAYDCN